ncbi:phage tail tape measure protein [Segatella copri]|uniref:phage tail tape measure protein n=1 Tax=Segatella copri TaxID=165179 RepID=UPI00293A275B|nr:phage tail tape measure protein [Segatella copri]MDV3107049.1 phage tail tape measure protein [Segatella copri]
MVSEDKQQILDIKVKYEDAIYGIIRYKEKIDQLKASIKDLQQQEKDKTITTNEMKVQTEAINATIKEYQYNVRALQKEIQNNVRTENEQEGSLKQLRAQLSNATKKYDEMAKAEREGAKGQALQKHINEITNELKLAEEQTQRYYRNVGNYYNSMLDLAADLQHVVPMGGGGGVGEGVSNFANTVVNLGQTVKGIIPNIKAFFSTLLGLATNPVFLGLAGVAGAGMAFKWWFDYNKGLMEATRLTREFTGYTGEALETMRNSIAVTADTMGKDFNDVLATADNLMANYHLSGEEAMKVINDGFASGADLSGDMLNKIQQYAPTFHDAGIGADQLVAILQQTRSGIFSDKGLDIITMASKKIREMSTATSASLDAIGVSSKQVQQDLANGTKSTFDVIQEVSTKMKDFGADSKQVGDILKNVFGKQGAQAGIQLIEQLDTMTTDIEEVKKQTGEWGETQLENIKLHKELNSYLSSMFDMSQHGFEEMIEKGKMFGTKILIQIMKGLFNTINYFIDWYNESLLLRGVINTLGTSFRLMWNAIKLVCNLGIDAFKRMGFAAKGMLDILEGIVTFDLSKAQKGFKEIFDISGTIKEAWHDIKNAGIEIGNSFADGFENTVNGRLNHLKLANLDGGATSSEPVNGNKGTTPSAAKGSTTKTKAQKAKEEAEAKAEAERRKKQEKELQAQIALIQFQYNENVMDAKKRYLAGMYDNERDYSNDLEQLEKDMVARSIDAYVAAGQIGAEKAQEMQAKLLDIMIKAKADIKNQAKEIVDGINKEFEDAEKARKDADILGGGTSDEENDNAAKLERYRAFLEQKLAMEQTNTDARKQLQQQLHDTEVQLADDSNKKQQQKIGERQQMMANMISTLGDGLASFFNEQDKSFHNFLKSMLTSLLDAIEMAITAYYAQMLAHELAEKSWYGVASAAGMMVLTKAAFAGAKAAVKGFSTGGYVQGSGTGTSDSIPARLSNGESVMTAKATSMFSPILSAFNQLGGGVPIVANTGGSNIGMDMLAAAVARGYQMAPQPVVSVEEINRTQRRVQTIESIGRL